MEGTPVSSESQEEKAWTVFVVRIFLDDLCAAHGVFNLVSPDTAPEHSSRCVPGDFVMRCPEGNTDLLQMVSIIGHKSHHSRDEHYIKTTFPLGSSRVLSARPGSTGSTDPASTGTPSVDVVTAMITPDAPVPEMIDGIVQGVGAAPCGRPSMCVGGR
jgi:hypothetical protein